ncbi:MAG: prepilin peptidase [Anaerolineales bacterium]|nr:prepilin peptidase [Anaerolineales bacterium]
MLIWALSGFLLGVLICYLADVLPVERRLARPHWWPLSLGGFLGYLTRPRNLAVVLLAVFFAVFIAQYPQTRFPAYQLLLIAAYLGLVVVIDIEHRLVLHMVSLAGVFLFGAIGVDWNGPARTLLGGAAGFAIMLGLFVLGDWLGRLLARLRGRPWTDTALGFGDVTISGVIGLLMGWPAVLSALLFGIFAAGIFSLLYLAWMLLTRRYQPMMGIAYAPFLCLGVAISIALAIHWA